MSRDNHDASTPKKTPPPALWWETMEEECPITLEPLSSLPYPPFILEDKYYFDGVALASYMVSRGMFENPLTRKPLDYQDCQRLDAYVKKYHGHDARMAVCCEAYCLRESVRVSSNNSNEDDDRRAQVLRNEATAALCHLFVYGRHTNNGGGDVVTSVAAARPSTSFNLYEYEQQPATSAVEEMEGLRIIDDDEERFEQAERSEWRQVQQAFPPLSSNNTTPDAVHIDQHLLSTVQQTSITTQQDELQRRKRLQQAQIRLMQEARQRQEERKRAREAAQVAQRQQYQQQRQEEDELERARAEIDKWRKQHWDKLLEESNNITQNAPPLLTCQPKPLPPPKEKVDQVAVMVDEEKEREVQAAKKKARAAAKRRRAKERKREKKEVEREEARKREELELREQKKATSDRKCACCGDGILGHGFEKYGHHFCSTKCARSGARVQ